MQNDGLIKRLEGLIQPIADDLNYELYHLEFVKEGGENYLRIYIDKEEGKISITDCEAISRRVSTMLDEEDPIEVSYYLEVSSPGLNRGLFKESHYKKNIGSEVLVKLTSSIEGSKNLKGTLKSVANESIVIVNEGKEVTIPKDKIKQANLDGEI